MLTKDDVYEYLGRKFCGFGEGQIPALQNGKSDLTKKRLYVAKNATPDRLIAFEKMAIKNGDQKEPERWDQLPNIPPLKELQSDESTPDVFLHPFWNKVDDDILNEFKPKSDTMLIVSCSNNKPYKDNANYSVVKKYADYVDIFVNSLSLWPMDFSNWLYARVYDVHGELGPETYALKTKIKFNRIVRYLEKFKYKRLIVWAYGTLEYNMLLLLVEDYCKRNGIEYHEIVSEDIINEAMTVYKSLGLVKMHIHLITYCAKKLESILGINKDE